MTPTGWAVLCAALADPGAWAGLVGAIDRWPAALTRRHRVADSDADPVAERWDAEHAAPEDATERTTMTDQENLAHLCLAAERVIQDGIAFARGDDPHRFATLGAEFDNGKAMRRLVLDYLANGEIRITQLLHGSKAGEPRMVEVFSTLVQGPQDPGTTH